MKKTPGTQKRENEIRLKIFTIKRKRAAKESQLTSLTALASSLVGIGKKLWNQQTEPKRSFGIPEGVHRYVERRSLLIARKGTIL